MQTSVQLIPMRFTRKQAEAIAGTLSQPSKMPCHGYSIPASMCIVGSALAQIEGSTCHKCYANKGRYSFANVQDAMHRRAASLTDPRWKDAMVALILSTKNDYFRWHDSGDLQSFQHLLDIVYIAEQTPNVRHWLPTREYKFVDMYQRTIGDFPDNLTVRMSAHIVDQPAPKRFANTSTVHKALAPNGFACRAPAQGNQCLDCRACWDKTVANVSYHAH